MGSKLLFITFLAVSLHRLFTAIIPPHYNYLPVSPSATLGTLEDFKHPFPKDDLRSLHVVQGGRRFNPMGVGPQIEPFEHFQGDQVLQELSYERTIWIQVDKRKPLSKENARVWMTDGKQYNQIGDEKKQKLEKFFDGQGGMTDEDRKTLRGIRWSLRRSQREMKVWWNSKFIEKSQDQYQELVKVGDLLRFKDVSKNTKALPEEDIIDKIVPTLNRILSKHLPPNQPLNLKLLAQVQNDEGKSIYHERIQEVLKTLYTAAGLSPHEVQSQVHLAALEAERPEKFQKILAGISAQIKT